MKLALEGEWTVDRGEETKEFIGLIERRNIDTVRKPGGTENKLMESKICQVTEDLVLTLVNHYEVIEQLWTAKSNSFTVVSLTTSVP